MAELAAMPKYDAYKDSGVEWLGKIPNSWEVKRFKFLLNEINDRSESGEEDLLSVSHYTGVTLKSDKVNDGDLLTNAESLEGYKKVSKGDLVSNIMLAWNGSLGISPYDGITSPAYSIYRFRNGCSERFYHYLLRTEIYKAEFKRRSTGVIESRLRLYSDAFFDVVGVLPSMNTQVSIANFLDKKTAQIDEAIAIKEKQIELLKERKQIIIQQAVTQGLDTNAPMKDSGVDWIGEIPEHWEAKKIKYLTEIFRGKFTHRPRNDPAMYDGEYPFFQTGDVARAGKYLSKYKQTLNERGLRVSTLIPKGTVVITIAANIGDVSILALDACFPDSVVGFNPNKDVVRDFLYYALGNMKQQFMDSSIKNTQMNLNVDRIGSNYICQPPEKEQQKIVEYIEEKTQAVDSAIGLQFQQIEKLKEYKTTLINSAVTGKIKVTAEI